MRNHLTSLVFLGTVWGLSSAVNAADKPASYEADGACYCNLPIPASLSGEIVSTPIGGQSLAQVCERVGKGPGLKKSGTSFNHPAYNDMQCGHGPGLTGFTALLREAGMNEGDVGAKWDLETAYANDVLLAQGKSSDNSSSLTEDAIETGEVRRLRSRYIKVPAATTTATGATANLANSAKSGSEVIKPSTNSHAVAATQQVSSTAQSKAERRRIEALPVAELLPLEGEAPSDERDAPIAEAAVITSQEEIASVVEQSTDISKETETVVSTINSQSNSADVPATTAIRAPKVTSGAISRKFEYLSVMPLGYDFGGAGVQLSASAIPSNNYRIMARAGIAEDYQEVLVGGSYVTSLGDSDRLTFALTGGLEYGRFNLSADSVTTNSISTGVFVRAQTGYALTRRLGLQGGVGFSSFFEGDPHVFGAALFQLTQKLDFIGEFEVGDNDSAGIGIRYHYR